MRATEMCATIYIYDKMPHSSAKRNVVLFYLLKIITKVMIKATAMIVTPTSP